MARQFASSSSQYLSRNDGLALTGPPLTVAGWFFADTSHAPGLITLWNNSGGGHRFLLGWNLIVDNKIYVQTVGPEGLSNAVTTTPVSTGTWFHACGVWTSTSGRAAFLNGGGKGAEGTTITPAAPNVFHLGMQLTSNHLNGRAAEVAIWNAALADDEVAALAKRFSPPQIRPASLVAYYPLFGNESPEPDRWRNRFDLTLNNSPTKGDHPPMIYAV